MIALVKITVRAEDRARAIVVLTPFTHRLLYLIDDRAALIFGELPTDLFLAPFLVGSRNQDREGNILTTVTDRK